MAFKLTFPCAFSGSVAFCYFVYLGVFVSVANLAHFLKEGIAKFKRLVVRVSHITTMCTTNTQMYTRGTGKLQCE